MMSFFGGGQDKEYIDKMTKALLKMQEILVKAKQEGKTPILS